MTYRQSLVYVYVCFLIGDLSPIGVQICMLSFAKYPISLRAWLEGKSDRNTVVERGEGRLTKGRVVEEKVDQDEHKTESIIHPWSESRSDLKRLGIQLKRKPQFDFTSQPNEAQASILPGGPHSTCSPSDHEHEQDLESSEGSDWVRNHLPIPRSDQPPTSHSMYLLFPLLSWPVTPPTQEQENTSKSAYALTYNLMRNQSGRDTYVLQPMTKQVENEVGSQSKGLLSKTPDESSPPSPPLSSSQFAFFVPYPNCNSPKLQFNLDHASGRLLSDYKILERARMARTPETAPQFDNVMMEARNLRNLAIAQTPLLGDETTPLHTGPEGGFAHQITFTPNPLMNPRRQGSLDVSGGVFATPLRMPLRNTLSINPGDHLAPRDDPRDQQLHSMSTKRALKAGFMSLPRLGYNFELLPDDDLGEGPIVSLSKQDASDRDERIKRAQHEEELRVLNRRSQAVQLGLLRPINVDLTALMQNLSLELEVLDTELAHAQELVNAELVKLVHRDSVEYPLLGTTTGTAGALESLYDPPDDGALEAAKIATLSSRLMTKEANKATKAEKKLSTMCPPTCPSAFGAYDKSIY